MPLLYWEDFTLGRVFDIGPRCVPRDEMLAFAAEFDPQPMHLDEHAARQSMMGGLCASGWYVCSIFMRMCFDGILQNAKSLGAPGVDEVRWRAAVRPDDELRLRGTVVETRVSRTRPEMGFVRFRFEMFNAAGECVMTLIASLMIGRRMQADAPP